MIYGTQINTQKNLIGARSIRKSLLDQLDDGVKLPGTSDGRLPPVDYPVGSRPLNYPVTANRINRVSGMSSYDEYLDGNTNRVKQAFL